MTNKSARETGHKNAEVLLWKNIRKLRNAKLAETDWTALSDRYCTNEMQIYRQKLRDITSDNTDPDDIKWPVKP